MNLRRIKHMLLRLSPEEKLVGAGAILVLFSTFLPWFSVTFNSVEKPNTVSGFSGYLGVIGFVVFLITAMALISLVAKHLHIRLPDLGFKKDQITLFLMGESAFLLLLTVAIYTKRSLDYTSAEIRFGLYLALIGAFAGAIASFSQIQKGQKKEVKAFFSQEEEMETAETSDDAVETQHTASNETTKKPKINEIEDLPKKEEQKSFFYEEQEMDQETQETAQKEVIELDKLKPEDDTVEMTDLPSDNETSPPTEGEEPVLSEIEGLLRPNENVVEQPTEQPPADEIPTDEPNGETAETNPADQGGYFVREAGVQPASNIKVDMESIRRVDQEEPEAPTVTNEAEKEPAKENSDQTSFYDDL